MHYYVMKTGMEMFDVCRAYGLGLVLENLAEKSAVVNDHGIHYSVEVDVAEIEEFDKKEIEKKLLPLFGRDLPWRSTFLTIQRKQRGELKSGTKRNVEKAKKTILGRVSDIIKKCKFPSPVKIPDPAGETLYLSMELAATKGYRVPIKTKAPYTEGAPLKVPVEDWALAALGETHFAMWKNTVDTLVFVIPKPIKVMVEHARDIRSKIYKMKVCRISTTAALAHLAVIISHDLQMKKISGDPFVDKFSSLIYGAARMTRAQLKPASGGMFPMGLLLDLMELDLKTSGEIFKLWNHIFRVGSIKGCEELPLSLSEFIACPTINNLEKHLRVHLRHVLKEGVKLKSYPKHCIVGVLKSARS